MKNSLADLSARNINIGRRRYYPVSSIQFIPSFQRKFSEFILLLPQFEFVPLDFSLSASLVCAIPSLLFDLSWRYFPFSDACYPSSYHSLSISLPILGFMVWFNVLHCLHSEGYWLLYLHG